MKPIDYRNATYHDLLKSISGQREATLLAWRRHGPCTTEELAVRSGLSILTLRPRTTELFQMGFVRVADAEKAASTNGAIYRAATTLETQAHITQYRRISETGQCEMPL